MTSKTSSLHVPLEEFKLNIDPNPPVIRKKAAGKVELVQNVSVKFLQPPKPQQPGDITITQEPDVQAPPAPPLHITQRPPLPLDQDVLWCWVWNKSWSWNEIDTTSSSLVAQPSLDNDVSWLWWHLR